MGAENEQYPKHCGGSYQHGTDLRIGHAVPQSEGQRFKHFALLTLRQKCSLIYGVCRHKNATD